MRVHMSLPVTDLDASVRFYQSFLGSAPSRREPGYANFRLDAPPIHLALVGGPAAREAGCSHYGIEVASREELESWRARLRDAGLAAREETNETCCYAVADKVWARDPDGREWEVWLRLADAPVARSATTSCCA